MGDDPSLRELLLRARFVISEALCHDDVPFEIIADHLSGQRVETLYPFFQTMFSLEPPVADAGPGWEFTTMDFDPGGARLDLYIEIDDRPSGMLGRAQYNTGLFTESTIARMTRDLEKTLAGLIANPEVRLSQIAQLELTSDVARTDCQ
jgi:non-ribosomal peptide synthetase component F